MDQVVQTWPISFTNTGKSHMSAHFAIFFKTLPEATKKIIQGIIITYVVRNDESGIPPTDQAIVNAMCNSPGFSASSQLGMPWDPFDEEQQKKGHQFLVPCHFCWDFASSSWAQKLLQSSFRERDCIQLHEGRDFLLLFWQHTCIRYMCCAIRNSTSVSPGTSQGCIEISPFSRWWKI